MNPVVLLDEVDKVGSDAGTGRRAGANAGARVDRPRVSSAHGVPFGANSLAVEQDNERFSWDAYFGGDVDFSTTRRAPLGAGRLPRGPRRRVSAVRSQPGVLHAGGVVPVPHRRDRDCSAVFSSCVAASQRPAETVRDRLERGGSAGAAPLQRQGHDGRPAGGRRRDRRTRLRGLSPGGRRRRHARRRPINPRLGWFVHFTGELFAVDGTVPDRGTQTGERVEAGLRINGRAGALGALRRRRAPPRRRPHRSSDPRLGPRRVPAARSENSMPNHRDHLFATLHHKRDHRDRTHPMYLVCSVVGVSCSGPPRRPDKDHPADPCGAIKG